MGRYKGFFSGVSFVIFAVLVIVVIPSVVTG